MSAGSGTITSPFGGLSLSELRVRASEVGRPVALMPVAPASWDEPHSVSQPSFDELLFMAIHETVDEQPTTWSGSEQPVTSHRVGIALLSAVVPLLLGAVIYLGLAWSTSSDLGLPEWLPALPPAPSPSEPLGS